MGLTFAPSWEQEIPYSSEGFFANGYFQFELILFHSQFTVTTNNSMKGVIITLEDWRLNSPPAMHWLCITCSLS